MTSTDFKTLRLKMGKSQAQWGMMMGFSAPQQRVSEIETGKVAVSGQIATICALLVENKALKRKLENILTKA